MNEERGERVALRGTVPGNPGDPAPGPIDPETGQHGDYWVLSEAERERGFVRPVRRTYRHVGAAGPSHPLRDLTDEERKRFAGIGYVKFERYPEDSQITGKFWARKQLDSVGRGCGSPTEMNPTIAETYARDPSFYGSTFCAVCRNHLPVAEFVWDDGSGERVGS